MWSPRLKNVHSKIAFLHQEIRKIIKIVAMICQILRLICTKIHFRLESRPRWWGAYSAPPDTLAGLKGPTAKGRGGEGSVVESKKILKIDTDASAILAITLCLSVCLSVTSRFSIETSGRIELVLAWRL